MGRQNRGSILQIATGEAIGAPPVPGVLQRRGIAAGLVRLAVAVGALLGALT